MIGSLSPSPWLPMTAAGTDNLSENPGRGATSIRRMSSFVPSYLRDYGFKSATDRPTNGFFKGAKPIVSTKSPSFTCRMT